MSKNVTDIICEAEARVKDIQEKVYNEYKAGLQYGQTVYSKEVVIKNSKGAREECNRIQQDAAREIEQLYEKRANDIGQEFVASVSQEALNAIQLCQISGVNKTDLEFLALKYGTSIPVCKAIQKLAHENKIDINMPALNRYKEYEDVKNAGHQVARAVRSGNFSGARFANGVEETGGLETFFRQTYNVNDGGEE